MLSTISEMDPVLIAAAVIPAVILLLQVYRADRLEKEPTGLLISLLVFGVIATALAIVTETIGEDILLSSFDETDLGYLILSNFIVVALSEEGFKLLLLRWRMNLLTLSPDEARAMGVHTDRLRLAVILCATVLTASAVSVSGMIGWVGLVIPHFCRMLFGYDYRRLIPAGALFGAAFLLAVDDIARLVTTGELPLGILTAFVGAPLFVYLIVTGGGRRVH